MSKIKKPKWYGNSLKNHRKYVRRIKASGRFKTNGEICNFLVLALCGEAGELANLFKKHWRGDAVAKQMVADEMADVRIYLEHLATHMKIDLDAACRRKVAVVAQRLRHGKPGKPRT